MPRVTESLRKTWREQRAQNLEEREYTQSGRRRSPSDINEVDFDIAVHDYLLSLPVGAIFDARQAAEHVRRQRTDDEPSAHPLASGLR